MDFPTLPPDNLPCFVDIEHPPAQLEELRGTFCTLYAN